MTQQIWIEKIAAGLRNMNTTPDYLLLSDPPFAFPEICGIPTISTYIGVTQGYDGDSYEIFPCWLSDGDYSMEVYNFQKAYTNYAP
jgi:hypothetical protein